MNTVRKSFKVKVFLNNIDCRWRTLWKRTFDPLNNPAIGRTRLIVSKKNEDILIRLLPYQSRPKGINKLIKKANKFKSDHRVHLLGIISKYPQYMMAMVI